MNVLVATLYSLRGGGLSSHISDLLGSLKKAGHHPHLVDYDSVEISFWRKLWCMIRACGSEDYGRKRIMQARVGRIIKAIEKACAREAFDIIHCHDPISGYAATLSKSARDLSLVQTIHGPLVLETQMRLGWKREKSEYLSFLWDVEKTSFHGADRLIAVDTGQADIAKEQYKVEPSKIDIIFNAVSCSEIEKVAAEPPEGDLPESFVLVPRRLVKKTGVDVAIRAMALLAGELDLRLLSAGRGPERENLSKLVDELGLQDRVVFLGRLERPEVLKLAKRALAVLVPSKPSHGVVEATSIAAIEAMACGTPVIVSAIGGLAELVTSGYNGLTVPADDPATLAKAIKTIATDDDLREKIGSQASEYARTNLDVSVWLEKILQVYEKARAAKAND